LLEQLESLRTAWSNLDARAVVELYADKGLDTYDGVRSSKEEMIDWAKTGYEDLLGTEIDPFESLRIDVLSRDAAVVSWVNWFTEIDEDGQRLPEKIALMTQVWIREGGEWLILHSHESTRLASDVQ